MPTEAATDFDLVRDLLAAGMDVMRINCAHDDGRKCGRQWRIIYVVPSANWAGNARFRLTWAAAKLGPASCESGGRLLRIKPKRDRRGVAIAPAQVWLTPIEEPRPLPARYR